MRDSFDSFQLFLTWLDRSFIFRTLANGWISEKCLPIEWIHLPQMKNMHHFRFGQDEKYTAKNGTEIFCIFISAYKTSLCTAFVHTAFCFTISYNRDYYRFWLDRKACKWIEYMMKCVFLFLISCFFVVYLTLYFLYGHKNNNRNANVISFWFQH